MFYNWLLRYQITGYMMGQWTMQKYWNFFQHWILLDFKQQLRGFTAICNKNAWLSMIAIQLYGFEPPPVGNFQVKDQEFSYLGEIYEHIKNIWNHQPRMVISVLSPFRKMLHAATHSLWITEHIPGLVNVYNNGWDKSPCYYYHGSIHYFYGILWQCSIITMVIIIFHG